MTDHEPPEDTDDRAALLALLDDEPVPETWEPIPDDARRDDVVRALADTVRWARAALIRRDRVAAPFERELARLTARMDEAVAPRDNEVARLDDRIRDLAAVLYRLDPRTKTHVLPHGTVWSKATGGRREVVDQDAALAWARVHAPSAVKVSLLVSELPKAGDVPGTRITPEGRNFGARLGES
jgi:hypothetical protein